MYIENLGSKWEVKVMMPITIKVTAHNIDDAEDFALRIADEICDKLPSEAKVKEISVESIGELEKNVVLVHGENV